MLFTAEIAIERYLKLSPELPAAANESDPQDSARAKE
jgi:hypothetical protein